MSTTETKVKVEDLPWKLVDGIHLRITDAFGVYLPIKVSNGGGTQRKLMTRIVRAVNSHADMLEALEAAREELMHYHVEAQKKAFVIGQIALKGSTLLAVEAAIQKAKGGTA